MLELLVSSSVRISTPKSAHALIGDEVATNFCMDISHSYRSCVNQMAPAAEGIKRNHDECKNRVSLESWVSDLQSN